MLNALENKKAILFDMDGTLTGTFSGNVCANVPHDIFIMPNVFHVIAHCVVKTLSLYMVTNQGGVSYRYMTVPTMWSNLLMVNTMLGMRFTDIKANCFHEKGDPKVKYRFVDCAKPKPDMACEIMEDYGHTSEECVLVGDGHTDRLTAENANMDFIWAHDFFEWPKSYMEETHFGWGMRKKYLDIVRCGAKQGPCVVHKTDRPFTYMGMRLDRTVTTCFKWGNEEHEHSTDDKGGYSPPTT